MPKIWQYLVVNLKGKTYTLQKTLTYYGCDGWEFMMVIGDDQFVFKRKETEENKRERDLVPTKLLLSKIGQASPDSAYDFIDTLASLQKDNGSKIFDHNEVMEAWHALFPLIPRKDQ